LYKKKLYDPYKQRSSLLSFPSREQIWIGSLSIWCINGPIGVCAEFGMPWLAKPLENSSIKSVNFKLNMNLGEMGRLSHN
jgi:hypothetical protein